jgi:deoxyribodipyrimidine photo-lyase
MNATERVSFFWFRRDLRLDDNEGLWQALFAGRPVIPVFIFDQNILEDLEDPQDARVEFIHGEVSRLHQELQQAGSGLLVLHGRPLEVWKKIMEDYSVANVFTNRDYEPYAVERDAGISQMLEAKGVVFSTFKDQVIFEKGEITKDDGLPYTIYTPYSKKWKAALASRTPVPRDSVKYLKHCVQMTFPDPPSLKEIGFAPSGIDFPPRVAAEKTVKEYHLTRDLPAAERGTSLMGLHLRFGTVSVRALVREAQRLSATYLGELIWREFFMQILWHFPHVINGPFKRQYGGIAWRNDPDEFGKWCEGRTGFPLVDAGMRELNATGHMHNRVRMVVASFLTKDLLISWQWGEQYFAQKLLDYELSSNNGNWQWAAGTGCDAAPYFRIFNPDSQMRKFDPELKYVRKWVPEYGTPAYPTPMVDHAMARERCLRVYKEALRGGVGHQ